MPGPAPPNSRPNAGTFDLRPRFADLTAKTPVDDDFRAAFVKSKVRLAHTHPTLDLATRDVQVNDIIERLAGTRDLLTQPVPGGVGYGLFYSDAFKTNWGNGTSLAFDIVAPTPPGGNVSTWLYLTGMNRAALGVEAFVAYNGQGDTHFRVFDWARSDHWQTDIPLSALADYLKTDSAHDNVYQVLSVWNVTQKLDNANWQNQALLYNRVRGGWDLVYQFDYPASDAQQKTGFVGSWTAIVETFQSLYNQTNPMGALAAQLLSADAGGNWGNWTFLAASDSYVRTDNVGFRPVFFDPDYAFIVQS